MIFITLMKPKGKGAEAVQYLKQLKAPKGVKILNKYFTFGKYDAALIFEATDVKLAMNFVMNVGFATDYTVETMTAVSVEN